MPRRDDTPHACDTIRKGDVILWNGRRRTVRKVCYRDDGLLDAVYFSILRKSWTRRAYTLYHRHDVKKAFGGVIGRRTDNLCSTPLECTVQSEIDDPLPKFERRILAEEMVGRVW